MNIFKSLCLVFIFGTIFACSSSNEALVERKENFYYGRSKTLQLIKLPRTKSLREVAASYGVTVKELARANGKTELDYFSQGDLVKIPIDRDSDDYHYNDNDLQQDNEKVVIEEERIFPQDQETVAIEEKKIIAQEDLSNNHFDKELIKDLSVQNNIAQVQESNIVVAQNKLEPVQQPKAGSNVQEFIWPIKGKLLFKYGKVGNSFKEGIAISSPIGSVIKAVADGDVVYVGKELKIYGNLIILKHNNNYMTTYAHCDKIHVIKGSKVKQGQSLGTVGKTSGVFESQLWFAIRKNKINIDPETLLGK